MTMPEFVAPQPPPSFSVSDYVDEVVVLVIGGHHAQVPTREYGVKPALSVTAVPLTGPNAGRVIEDAVVFGKPAACYPDAAPGTVSLVTVVKEGRGYVFKAATSDYATQLAQRWVGTVDLGTLRKAAIGHHQTQATQYLEQMRGGATSTQWTPPHAEVTRQSPFADQPPF